MNRIADYLKYHADSSRAMDIDIQVEAIKYLTAVMRMTREQQLWLSFLFATTYCMATAWVIFNRFPRYDHGTVAQLTNWWKANKKSLIFQTDRRWVKSRDEFVPVILSYRRFIDENDPIEHRQFEAIQSFIQGLTPKQAYEKMVNHSRLVEFGRFAMFLYSELLYHAGLPIQPVLRLDEARSVRNGVVFALGIEDSAYTGRDGRDATPQELAVLTQCLNGIIADVQKQNILPRHKSIWSIETTLCAYKKWHLGKRYVGYYIERTIDECLRMRKAYPEVHWRPIDAFSMHYYPRQTQEIFRNGFKPSGFKAVAYHKQGNH